MNLDVTILGSGTSVPCATRMAPAYLLQAGEFTLLLDCGSGSCSSLARQGISLGGLSAVVLSHLHMDHVADLPVMTFALVNPLGPLRSEDLVIRGPVGTADYFAALEQLYGTWMHPRDATTRALDLAPGETFSMGPLNFSAHRAEHSGACLSYRVEAAGQVVCFSGDTEPCDGLAAAARGAELLICECSVLEHEEGPGHMKASQVGQLATAVGVGRVVLSHIYPHVEASDPVSVVRRHYQGPVELAADGMRVTLGRTTADPGAR